jgi:hypothetical protein
MALTYISSYSTVGAMYFGKTWQIRAVWKEFASVQKVKRILQRTAKCTPRAQ